MPLLAGSFGETSITPQPLIVVLGLLAGAIIGSFLATILVRWPQGRSVVHGRSACDACGVALGWRDLVPLASFIRSRGRCRACGAPIDPRHWQIELTAAGLGGAVALLVQHPLELISVLLAWQLLLLAWLDAEHFWLPLPLTGLLILSGLAAALLPGGLMPAESLLGAGAGWASLAFIRYGYRWLRKREGMGGGDPLLFAGIGAWLGWQPLPAVLLAAAIIGLGLALIAQLRGVAVTGAMRLPLGTCLGVAGLIALGLQLAL